MATSCLNSQSLLKDNPLVQIPIIPTVRTILSEPAPTKDGFYQQIVSFCSQDGKIMHQIILVAPTSKAFPPEGDYSSSPTLSLNPDKD